jgi:hypothetical protein
MSTIKLRVKAKKGKLSIELPEDLKDKTFEVTIQSIDETQNEAPSKLFGLLKGRFSNEEISEFTKEARASWDRNI